MRMGRSHAALDKLNRRHLCGSIAEAENFNGMVIPWATRFDGGRRSW